MSGSPISRDAIVDATTTDATTVDATTTDATTVDATDPRDPSRFCVATVKH